MCHHWSRIRRIYLYTIHSLMILSWLNIAHCKAGDRLNSGLSENITRILNQLVNASGPNKYDKRLRPNYGGEPVDVGIDIHVSSISAVSEIEMDYTLDIYLRQMWTDPRLAFNGIKGDLTIGVHYLKNIWVPDTFFPNEKRSFFHEATTHNSFLRIKSKGEVLTSQRLTVTATCPMNLHLFPLDSQECTLEIESYGYTTDDIRYCWSKKGNRYSDSVTTEKSINLPQFVIAKRIVTQFTKTLSSGKYSRLSCKFIFKRQIGFYLIQIYLPSTLIVVISWVSFWISRDATPARVALGVTTVLTMTTLIATTNRSMPKVSYIKSIDLYLGVCFIMVFASLLEYAAVGYLNKHLRMRRERKKKQRILSTVEHPTSNGVLDGGTLVESRGFLRNRSGGGTISVGKVFPPTPPGSPFGAPMREVNPMQQPFGRDYATGNGTLSASHMPNSFMINDTECDCDIVTTVPRLPIQIKPLRVSKPSPRRNYRGITPAGIDKYSRMVFPILFFVFKCLYWVIGSHLAKALMQGYIDRSLSNTLDPSTDDCSSSNPEPTPGVL